MQFKTIQVEKIFITQINLSCLNWFCFKLNF